VRAASKLLSNTMFSYRGMGLSMVGRHVCACGVCHVREGVWAQCGGRPGWRGAGSVASSSAGWQWQASSGPNTALGPCGG
jgi:hypothetical protein